MSALGHKQTYLACLGDVRFTPESERHRRIASMSANSQKRTCDLQSDIRNGRQALTRFR